MARRFRAMHVYTGKCDDSCWWHDGDEHWEVVVRRGIAYTFCLWWQAGANYEVRDEGEFV